MPPRNQRRRLSLETLESRRLLTLLAVTDEVYKTVRFTIDDGTYQARITSEQAADGLYVDDFIGVADYTGTLVYNSPTNALGRLEAVGSGSGTDNYHDEEGDLDSYAFEFDGHGTLVDENGQFRLFSGDQTFRYTAGDQPNLANPNGRAGGSPFSTSVNGTLDTTVIPWQVTGVFTRRTGSVTFDGDVELGPAALSETEPFDAAFESGLWLAEQGTATFDFVSTGLVLPSPAEGRETPVADIRVYYASGPEREDILDEGNPIAGGDAIPIFWNSKEASITLTELPPAPPEAKYIIAVADYDGAISEANEPNKGNNLLAIPPAIIVNSTDDTPDDDTTDFVCADADGNCTLRAAIQTANAIAGADTINFDLGSGNHVIEVENSGLPQITDAVTIDATSQEGYAETADGYPIPAIELRGTPSLSSDEFTFTDGLNVNASNSTIRGLAIQKFPGAGIDISEDADNVTVESNVIGLDRQGQQSERNRVGIKLGKGAGSLITRNVVAGNTNQEIDVSGERHRIVQNRVGVDSTGHARVLTPHEGDSSDFEIGIDIYRGAGIEVIDNQVAGEPWIDVSPNSPRINEFLFRTFGNIAIQLVLSNGNIIRGNTLNYDADGVDDLFVMWPYGGDVRIIGGSGNTISDNLMTSFEIFDYDYTGTTAAATGNTVTSNRIGTDATVVRALEFGASLVAASGNVVGGSTPEEANYFGTPLYVEAAGNRVEGNFFGVQRDGQTSLAFEDEELDDFGDTGITLSEASDSLIRRNTIGFRRIGIEIQESTGNQIHLNTIFRNAKSGIQVDSKSKRNDLFRNIIFDNDELGIDLNRDGVTPNDFTDADSGANGSLNFPTFAHASLLEAVGALNTSVGVADYRLEFFADGAAGQTHGQGRNFLGFKNVTTTSDGFTPFTFTYPAPRTVDECITATATDSSGNTSEFSRCAPVSRRVFIAAAAEAGDARLALENTADFDVGDTVVVDPNGPRQELAVVTGFGSLILSRPLRFDHPAGTTVIAVGPDFDADGIDNDIENAAPNKGDGNNDGILDAEQPHVVSLVNPVTGQYVTLVAPEGARLGDVEIVAAPPAPPPNGVTFPWGFLSYSLLGAAEDGRATVTAILAQTPAPQPNAYYHYGATSGDAAPHWYGFRFDAASGTGATWADTVYTFALQDGQRGDYDGAVNGVITAVGGPAVNQASWHNAENPFDVNRDGLVGMQDLLLVVSNLRDPGPRPLVEPPDLNDPRVAMLDVDDNQRLDVHDLLVMVVELRRLLALNAGGSGDGELERMGGAAEEKEATLPFDESIATIANDVAATYSLTERKRLAAFQLFRLPGQR
jgi:CSLREA domain-containing protein